MATRTIYVRNRSLWDKVIAYSKKNNIPVSQMIEQGLELFFREETDTCLTCSMIRELLNKKSR